MKRIISLVLCILLMLSLVACAGTTTTDPAYSDDYAESQLPEDNSTEETNSVGSEDTDTTDAPQGQNTTTAQQPTGGQKPTGGQQPTGGQKPTGGQQPTGGQKPTGGQQPVGSRPATQTQGKNPNKTTVKTTVGNQKPTQGGAQIVNNCIPSGFPLAKDKVTLTVMIKDYSGLTSYSKMAINQYFEQRMNVKIKWIVVPGGAEVNTQAQLAYQSGNLPDIFMGMEPLGYSFHWQYIEQGFIKPLDDYIAKYGTNIKKMFKAVPQAQYLCTAPDGKIYMLPVVDSRTENTGKYAELMYINKKWLNNLGLSAPKTTADLKKVLKAFKDQDANGNGIMDDEIPMMVAQDIPNGFYGAFGMSVYNELMYVDNNRKVQYAPVQNAYKKALIFFNELYKEKLVNNDMYMQDSKGIASAVAAGKVGMFFAAGLVNTAGEKMAKDYAVLAPLTGPDGQRTYTCQTTEMLWPGWFLVTNKCKYPEIAVRLADYMYSVEGSYVAQYGPPGKNTAWNYNADGKVVLSEKLTSDNAFKYQFTPGWPMPAWLSDQFVAKQYNKPANQLSAVEKISREVNQQAVKLYEPVMPKYKLEKTNATEDEINLGNTIRPGISEHATKMRKQFVTSGNVEATWDTYIAQMKQLKVDQFVKLNNDAYQRYVAWEKANVK